RGGPGPGVVGEADLGEGGPAALEGGRGAVEAEHDVGQHPAPGEQPGLLEDDRPGGGDPDAALVVGVQPGQRAQEGGLAGAAAPEQGDELVPPDLEVDTGEDLAVAEAAAEPAGHGDVLAGGQPALRRRGVVG